MIGRKVVPSRALQSQGTATVTGRFHLKVEAVDSVGHHGSADTTESGPISVDRSRPRSRIIGLDPSSQSGAKGADTPSMR